VKKKKRELVLAKVHLAVTEVADAAKDLDALLSKIESSPRAQKTTITKAVQDAFSRLKIARVALKEVELILAKEPEE
jgi:hypothetical protein